MSYTYTMNPKIFKAYDVRGKYPKELNENVVFKIAQSLKKYFKTKDKLILGYDARLSSVSLYKSLIKGLKDKKSLSAQARKFRLIEGGMMTTPTLYFLVNDLKAAGGIMITASHNPKEYNGLKVVSKNAQPVSGEEMKKIVLEK